MANTFRVERLDHGEWRMLPFAESQSVKYCHGFVDCIDSHYPSPPVRIVKISGGVQTVVRETKGRKTVDMHLRLRCAKCKSGNVVQCRNCGHEWDTSEVK